MTTQILFKLPQREGEKPKTNSQPPHLQFSQKSPRAIYDELAQWMFKTLPMHVSTIREHPSMVSLPTSRALWLDEEVQIAHHDAFMPSPDSREFTHLHEEGSLHLVVSEEVEQEILDKRWGELHPWHDRGVKVILFYAARDVEEIVLAKQVIIKSYEYATGNVIDLEAVGH